MNDRDGNLKMSYSGTCLRWSLYKLATYLRQPASLAQNAMNYTNYNDIAVFFCTTTTSEWPWPLWRFHKSHAWPHINGPQVHVALHIYFRLASLFRIMAS